MVIDLGRDLEWLVTCILSSIHFKLCQKTACVFFLRAKLKNNFERVGISNIYSSEIINNNESSPSVILLSLDAKFGIVSYNALYDIASFQSFQQRKSEPMEVLRRFQNVKLLFCNLSWLSNDKAVPEIFGPHRRLNLFFFECSFNSFWQDSLQSSLIQYFR